MRYPLFLLVTATLFIRPAEIFPDLLGLPIYECAILSCLAVSLPQVGNQLSIRSLRENPITACVIGVLVAIVLSHLSHFFLWGARNSGEQFLKVVLYYLLLIAAIDTEERLKNFLGWLFIFIAVLAGLALLDWFEIVDFPFIRPCMEGMEDAGDRVFLPRMQSTGIFSDPNDLAMILVVGVVLSIHYLTDPKSGLLRPLFAATAGGFVYSIYLTQSRGGLLALLAALGTLFHARWGTKRTLIVACALLPAMLLLMKGRITAINEGMDGGTGHSRIELWSAGLQFIKQQPVFGIGCGNFAEEAGLAAHNSFVHTFAELGLFGGTLFLGAFVSGLLMLYRLRDSSSQAEQPDRKRLLASIIAILAGMAVSMLSLSRAYVVTPYVALGLVMILVRLAPLRAPPPVVHFDARLLRRMAAASMSFLFALYVLVRVSL